VAHSEFFPEPTAHEIWIRNRIPRGAHYDPTDDGPEVAIIMREGAVKVFEVIDAVAEHVAGSFSMQDLVSVCCPEPSTKWDDNGPMEFIVHGRD